MPEIIDRKTATAAGLARFYTGVPCKHGHLCERYVANAGCVYCINPRAGFMASVAVKLEALERYVMPNGREVLKMTQEEAHALRRERFFTGVPCAEGHMAERYTKDGRCVDCMHPVKYGPHGHTGWLPFQPTHPFRVPPGMPLRFWDALAEKIQAAIPGFVKEIEAEGGATIPVREYLMIGGMMHVHYGRKQDVLCANKLWYPLTVNMRGFSVPEWMEPEAFPHTMPWIQDRGVWYALTMPQYEMMTEVVRQGHKMPTSIEF